MVLPTIGVSERWLVLRYSCKMQTLPDLCENCSLLRAEFVKNVENLSALWNQRWAPSMKWGEGVRRMIARDVHWELPPQMHRTLCGNSGCAFLKHCIIYEWSSGKRAIFRYSISVVPWTHLLIACNEHWKLSQCISKWQLLPNVTSLTRIRNCKLTEV